MLYCEHCGVYIRDKDVCPLCSNSIKDNLKPKDTVFPHIPFTKEKHMALKIMIFISIVTIVISFAIYNLMPTKVNWPVLVFLGLVSMWLSLSIIIRKRYNISKNIMWQVTIVSVLSIFWDWKIGWLGWSLDLVIPITCVIAMLVMYVTAKVMKLSAHDYLVYLLLNGLFGVVPSLFIYFGWVRLIIPSVVCISLSVIFLSAIFIFQGKNIRSELEKRMHI